MLYLVGLGMDKQDVSMAAVNELKRKRCKLYLDVYTTRIPYSVSCLERIFGRKIFPADRKFVEQGYLLKESKKRDVALLVYGHPLAATTHAALLLEAEKKGVSVVVFGAESIVTALSRTGFQQYKFGRIATLPKWQKSYKPESFFDIVLQNKSIGAHTLLLVDVGMTPKQALQQLIFVARKRGCKIDKVVVCSRIGTNEQKIFFGAPEQLLRRLCNAKLKHYEPFCIVVPANLHFVEQKLLQRFSKKM